MHEAIDLSSPFQTLRLDLIIALCYVSPTNLINTTESSVLFFQSVAKMYLYIRNCVYIFQFRENWEMGEIKDHQVNKELLENQENTYRNWTK